MYTVAIVGATGVVGREMIQILESSQFPVKKLIPLASQRSAGATLSFCGNHIDVSVLTESSFEGVDIALFSAGGSISAQFAPIAARAGAIVIDNTSHFRMDPNVPLIVPEVNAHALKNHNGIIANPNCSTAQLVVVLKPIHDKASIKRVVISTYQSVSGAGKEGIGELESQSRISLNGGEISAKKFQHPIAFNLIPQIDVFLDNGYTKEEMKMIQETKKIMEAPHLNLTATAVRVPVFVGHSEAINIQTTHKLSATDVRNVLSASPGIVVWDDPSKNLYPTPRQTAGTDPVYVGRIREDISQENSIDLWCVSDNLRKGAALNAVQIAQELINQGLI